MNLHGSTTALGITVSLLILSPPDRVPASADGRTGPGGDGAEVSGERGLGGGTL